MAHIRIWSWNKTPSRPRLAGLLRDYLGIRLADAAKQIEMLTAEGGSINVDRLEARSLAPFEAALTDLGANVELEL